MVDKANTQTPAPAGCINLIAAGILAAIVVGGCQSCSRQPDAPQRPVADAPRVEPQDAAAASAGSARPNVIDAAAPADEPALVTFVTLEDQPINGGSIRDVTVRIEEPISEDDLRALAKRIKADSRNTYPKTSIFFLLPGQEPGKGAWARAIFAPELKITILGGAKDTKRALEQVPLPSGEVIGDWYLDAPGSSSHRITLFRRDGKTFMQKAFGDGSSGEYEVVPLGGHRYQMAENPHGDWIAINERGNLDFYGGSTKTRAYTAAKTALSPPLTDDPTTFESVGERLMTATIERLEEEIRRIGEEKKVVGKTRDRQTMKELIEEEKAAKKLLLKARNRSPEEWAEEARSRSGGDAAQSLPRIDRTPTNAAATKLKREICGFIDELMLIKNTPEFIQMGIGAGSPHNAWWKRLESLRNSQPEGLDSPIPIQLRAAPGDLMTVVLQYVSSRGEETNVTRNLLTEIKQAVDYEEYRGKTRR